MEWRGDWEDTGDADKPYIERYTRVENPLPPLPGVWTWQAERERDDGQAQIDHATLTIGEAFTFLFEREIGGENVLSWSFSGSWRHDESRQFVFVDVQDVKHSNPEVLARFSLHIWATRCGLAMRRPASATKWWSRGQAKNAPTTATRTHGQIPRGFRMVGTIGPLS